MSECDTQLLAVPGLAEPLRLSLPADIRGLRDACLAAHTRPWGQLPELGIADATAWADRPDEEPWLLWRARRFAARLAAVPIGVQAGECIVGTLAFHVGKTHALRLVFGLGGPEFGRVLDSSFFQSAQLRVDLAMPPVQARQLRLSKCQLEGELPLTHIEETAGLAALTSQAANFRLHFGDQVVDSGQVGVCLIETT